ncbi:hypothetical protein [Microvirga terrestris]|uniref:hypothetical protein n=1 Tax=Microvirga terrestris TaxID=2791024 RepID=UPI001FEFEC48|nr:hypothetical protein [Microvirga terrestris]
MLTENLLDEENAREDLQRYRNPLCCVALRQEKDIGQCALRTEAKAFITNEALDDPKPLPLPSGDPGGYLQP